MLKVYKTEYSTQITITLPRFKPYYGAGVALFRKVGDKYYVLMGKRLFAPSAGKWSFPGGGKEKHETPKKTALRELYEETGIRLSTAKKPIGCVTTNFLFFHWSTYMYMLNETYFRSEKWKTEFSEMKFIRIDKVNKHKLSPFVKKVIQAFMKCIEERGKKPILV